VLNQVRICDTAAILLDDREIALAMFGRHGWRRVELALSITPDAHRHMRRLVRIAHLTLWAMAETRIIVAHVDPANLAGIRMARLVGFRPAKMRRRGVWVFRRPDGAGTKRRQRGCESGGGKEPACAASCE
jgi:hypothetical protein